MALRSSIDLGTNTCLLLIAEGEGSQTRAVEDHATVVRLGQGVDQNRRLHPDAMKRTLECLERYAGILRAAGADPARTVAVATSQARDSADAESFFKQIEERTGLRFRVLSGDQEAQYTFVGALLPDTPRDKTAVIDIGGGSTELVAEPAGVITGRSLDLGSVRFTERFLKSDPVADEEFWAAQEAIDQALPAMQKWRAGLAADASLVAVAGTATTLASWHLGLPQFDRAQIDGLELTRGDIHRLVEELKWRTVKERMQLSGMEPGRADVLLAGALILWRTMELLDFPRLRVSTRGLRYGVLSLA